MRTTLVISSLFAFAAAQSAAETTSPTTTSVEALNPTPDALDLEGIRNIPEPTFTVVEGLEEFDVPYETETAIATAAAEVTESPLSVFPAVTTVAINAAASTDAPAKRGMDVPIIEKRTACAAEATIDNTYGVNVSSYSAFKADPIIASVANAAPTPQGYFQNFKNLAGASSAYAYLGYSVVKTYNVQTCANKCSAKTGCLAFNIYFERDPVVEPGTGCENPEAFANIKCSFWGSALDNTTATNTGQWRSKFQVGIAGSNAYTSYQIGGPIDGWSTPLSLDNAVMNAPLRDCAGTWTYMGYKLFTSGPFDPQLCAAACDAQTEYNLKYPPSTGFPARCASFGTYLLTKTNSSGSYPSGQMCTMYTSAWDAQYAVNTASYDDSIGAKYTYSYSFFYSKAEQQPVCPSDVSYLQSSGAEFCTSFLSYTPSTSIVYTTSTPPASSVLVTSTETIQPTSTITVYASDSYEKRHNRRDVAALLSAKQAPAADFTGFTTVIDLAPTAGPSAGLVDKRAVATPASISNWPSAKISEGCAQVATGAVLATSTMEAPVPYTTLFTTVSTTGSAVVVTTTVKGTGAPAAPTEVCAPFETDDGASELGLEFQNYFSGRGVRSNSENPALAGFATLTAYYENASSLDQVVKECTSFGLNSELASLTVDLYYLKDTARWECIAYWGYNDDPSYYDVEDSNVGVAYSYVMASQYCAA